MRYVLLFVLLFGVLQHSDCSAQEAQQSNAALPRVLLIGDSISIGYTKPVIELLEGKVDVQRCRGNAGHTGMGLVNFSNKKPEPDCEGCKGTGRHVVPNYSYKHHPYRATEWALVSTLYIRCRCTDAN